ncbi:MAG: HdeD family acid-resistance protein [Reyranella sp.]|nr:HdeD family acid-resistance protein [Reyranella sp.]MBN9088128.1 HdeD family acid-resistance protein [Reyranella sp.]
MSTTDSTGPHSLGEGIRALRSKWGWILAFGIFSLIAGVVALGGSTMFATATAVYIVGFMMLFEGVAEIVAAFNARDWGHRLMWLLLGAIYVFAGFVCLQDPFQAATILTLLLGIALILGGLVRIFLATRMRQGTPWGWVVFSGLISVLLGLIIVSHWPVSSFFVLGIFLGVDLIFIGSGWISVALALKKHAA